MCILHLACVYLYKTAIGVGNGTEIEEGKGNQMPHSEFAVLLNEKKNF